MNESDIAALMRGVAPVLADIVAKAQKPLIERIDALETQVKDHDAADMIRALVADAVAALPKPADPQPGEPGPEGPPGKLPLARAFVLGAVNYEADVVTHEGATFQALRDTAQTPPHEDWICLAAAGAPGAPAAQIKIEGTFDPNARYGALTIVALNGASFISKRDDPGPCPGDGWQLVAQQGKRGAPGESIKGDPGKGIQGDPGAPVVAMTIDPQGMLTLVNGDGSTVDCDLYPLLSKIGGR